MIPYAESGVYGCRQCGLVCRAEKDIDAPVHCPRCLSPFAPPTPRPLAWSWALLLAAMIFYIPANLVPVTAARFPGGSEESTIFAGIVTFWQSGSIGIAVLIFIASIIIPLMKFMLMTFLLLSVRRSTRRGRRQRTLLYHLMEWTGYWSMLDVVVVVVVSGLVQFHGLASIEPRAGILFFALVVVLTMLAVLSFDPRVIWRRS